MPRLSSLPLRAALLALAAMPLAGQDLDQSVRRILAQADAGDLDAVWQRGSELGELDGQEDAIAQAIRTAVDGGGSKARIAAASGLRVLADGSHFGQEILDILQPALADDGADVRAAALSILADGDLFGRRQLPDVLALLDRHLRDELADARVRVAAARGLWRIGDDQQKRLAMTTLRDFLRSKNQALVVDAALTLAEFNTDSSGPEWGLLRDLALRPTPAGRLARSFVQREEQRRVFQRHLQNLLSQKLDLAPEDEFRMLRELMASARAQHIEGEQFDDERLLEAAAKGMMQALDPHSAYFSSAEFQRFFFDLDREYGGIGAFVNFDVDDDFSIVRPIYSGPAYRVGLRSGDKILQVDGWDTANHTSDEIIARLKGEPKTSVVVKIMRPGLLEPQDVEIVREEIQVPSVNHEMLPGEVGYAEVVTFGQNTAIELRRAVEDLRQRGALGLLLDLRNNTGGYLLAARDVVELFVPGEKMVVYTVGRSEEDREEYLTRNRAALPDVPLIVLINGFSASASEITAGALQDHGRATVVGTRSFGKGSVQSLLALRSQPPEEFTDENHNGKHDKWEPFEDRNGNGEYDVGPHIKLTVSRYHLPSGRCLHKDVDADGKVVNPDWGVTPDIVVDQRELEPKDAWKNAELFELFRAGKFQDYAHEIAKSDPDLAVTLAEGDAGATDRYPGFDEFYAGLDTHLDRDDVRRWVRYLLRDEAADLRGRAFPGFRALGDTQEDAQLQEGVRQILDRAGADIRDVPEYRDVLKIDLEPPQAAKR